MIIEALLAVMTIIQTLEVYWLLKSSQRTNDILENPAPVIVGLMEACKEDKEFMQAFGSFLAWTGQCAIAGFKEQAQQAGVKIPKIKSIGDLLGMMVQMPQIQAAIERKAKGMIEGAAEAKVEQVAQTWGL